jgi:hypothetical protein
LLPRAAAEVVDVASVIVASIGGRAGGSVVVVTMVELVVFAEIFFELRQNSESERERFS